MKIWNAGYQPVIAHPERYLYMEEKDYLLLKEKGYSFQLNLMSLSGYYGPHPKVVSEKLLKQKCTICGYGPAPFGALPAHA